MGMIDLHCHILPGIDDGAKTVEDSIAMAEKAISQGITHILCTPHHLNGKYTNPANDVIPRVARLQKEFDQRNLPITLLEGQEIRINGSLIDKLDDHDLLFTDLDNTYMLIEFPTLDVPAYTEQLFFELMSKGHIPVIVHPERNAKFREDPNRLIPFLDMGVLTQLTAPSIVGIFGKDIQKTVMSMMESNMLHMVASDAHGVNTRNFYLKEAYEKIEKEFGKSRVQAMQQVTKDLVNGDRPVLPEYSEIRKKRFGLF